MYSCSNSLFCINSKSHSDSPITSQPLPLHIGTTAVKSPGSIRTGCLWQCQERVGMEQRRLLHRHYRVFTTALEHQKPLQSVGICNWVDGGGYWCFLPTLKSFLLLTSLHATSCDFCHNSTKTKCHPTWVYWNFPTLKKYLFSSFWYFSIQNNISISSFGVA